MPRQRFTALANLLVWLRKMREAPKSCNAFVRDVRLSPLSALGVLTHFAASVEIRKSVGHSCGRRARVQYLGLVDKPARRSAFSAVGGGRQGWRAAGGMEASSGRARRPAGGTVVGHYRSSRCRPSILPAPPPCGGQGRPPHRAVEGAVAPRSICVERVPSRDPYWHRAFQLGAARASLQAVCLG